MKIAGESLRLPPEDVVIFPRPKGNLIFHIMAVATWEPFDAIYPRPKPPKILKRGAQIEDTEDATFIRQLETYAELRQAWLVLQSLRHPKNEIEWERVKDDQPQTWSEAREELKEIGLIETEWWYLLRKIYEVNALTEQAMEIARSNFLQMMSGGLNDN